MTVLKAGIGALFASAGCLALSSSYHVHSGDTLDSIAHKFHIPVHQLAVANGLNGQSVLRLGMSLIIPGHRSEQTSHVEESGGYTVREGQNDWIIAHKFGLTVPQLHRLNPGVDWSALRPGIHLNVGSSQREVSHESTSHFHEASFHQTSAGDSVYRVKEGDNDWLIAKKLGITHQALLDMNPHVDWSRLQPGEKINRPSSRVTLNYSRGSARNVTIAADHVILRRGPSTSSDEITEVNAGTLARVLGEHGRWYHLQFPKGTKAWVRDDFLVASHEAPSDEYAYHHSRYHYAYHRSRHGYIHGSYNYALHVPSGLASSKLLRTAYSMRGTPYVWGGTSRSGGFDCSGFTSTVFRKDGIQIPRTSREQSRVGKRVSRDDLKKGDLVFFRTLGSRRINHVGIYIGNGKFIQASSGRGHVIVSSLSDSYYRDHYAEARRILHHPAVKSHHPKPKHKK